jgi:phosphoserine phosphatase RsbU/P
MLGVLDNATYMDGVGALRARDSLMLISDGVTEAENAGREFFTEARLRSVLEGVGSPPVQQLMGEVLSSVESFTEGLEQGDDITLLAARFRPAEQLECRSLGLLREV